MTNGVNGVALLFENEWDSNHPTLFRLLSRAGVKRDDFYIGTASEPNLHEELIRRKIKVVMPVGERALGQFLRVSDIMRWRGRAIKRPFVPDAFIVPLLQPSKLMSKRGGDEEDDPLRHPPRFHGTWIRDLRFGLWLAEGHGEVPPDPHYLLDPLPESGLFKRFVDEYKAALAADPWTFLSWDIETPYKEKHDNEEELEEKEVKVDGVILRISFCFRPGYAISVTWNSSNLPLIKELLASPGPQIGWNGRTFDVPVVTAAGCDVKGRFYDGMDMYHLYQSDLPKGLEWVTSEAAPFMEPWKHLSQSETPGVVFEYNAIDADAALRNVLYLKERLETLGMWGLFERHVTKLMPILDRAGQQGNLMDRAKRDKLKADLIALRDRLVEEVQSYIPNVLFPRTEYKKLPEGLVCDYPLKTFRAPDFPITVTDTNGRIWDIVWECSEEKVCSVCGQFASNKSEHFKGTKVPKLDANGSPVLDKKTGKPKLLQVKNPCKEAGAVIELRPAFTAVFRRWEPFNPNSSDQLKNYMRHFGHPLGKDKKDASKETADANHLKALHKKYGTKHPLYSKTLVIHKVGKTIGTYTPEPDANDILHTQYVNSPSSWRLGSRKVEFGTQMQNWGKRKDDIPVANAEEAEALRMAAMAREQIIARPGHVLIGIDSAAVEAVMQGYFMNDPEYMRLASQSIHAWLACKKLGLAFTPENVDLVKDKYPAIYSKMKVTNYLTNFGGGPKLMHETYPDDFPSVRAAEETQDELYRLLPALKDYHHAVRWEAHTKTYVESPWGYRHYYYDVYRKDPRTGQLRLSKDSKRCVSFKPQNSNGGFQKDNLLLLAVSPLDGPAITDLDYMESEWTLLEREIEAGRTWARYMGANVTIHDSGMLDVPEPLSEAAADTMMTIWTRPIPQMRGLRIGAEVEIGKDWKHMERMSRVVVDDYDYHVTEAGRAA